MALKTSAICRGCRWLNHSQPDWRSYRRESISSEQMTFQSPTRRRNSQWWIRSTGEGPSEGEVERSFSPSAMDNAVLLCSEDKPHKCHRRVVAEYLRDDWEDVEIVHLG